MSSKGFTQFTLLLAIVALIAGLSASHLLATPPDMGRLSEKLSSGLI